MVMSLLHVRDKKEYLKNVQKALPLFSIISMLGIVLGVAFGGYYFLFKFNFFYGIIFLLAFMIGIATWIFTELLVRKVEMITKKDDKT